MSKKRRAELRILAWLEEEFAPGRKRVTPLYPYDSKTNAIRLPPSIEDELRVLVFSGNKVEAVKRVTALTGAGLRGRMDDVDGLTRELWQKPTTAHTSCRPRSSGCAILDRVLRKNFKRALTLLCGFVHRLDALKREHDAEGRDALPVPVLAIPHKFSHL